MRRTLTFIATVLCLSACIFLTACHEEVPHTHSFGEWSGNTATCTEGGTEARSCECGYMEYQLTEALCHDMKDGGCTRCGKVSFIPLVENGKAAFDIVYTSTAGAKTKIAIAKFVNLLRDRGVEISDPHSDTDGEIGAIEIIVGTDAKGRGDECAIPLEYIGPRGAEIRTTDERIIIAGGSDTLTKELFDKFTTQILALPEGDTDISYLDVGTDISYLLLSEYETESIVLGTKPLSDYAIYYDVKDAGISMPSIDAFASNLFDKTGYLLDTAAASPDDIGPCIVIRLTDDAGECGFRVYFSGDDFIIESEFPNALDKEFENLANELFFSGEKNISIAEDFYREITVSTVYYKDFGAVGDDGLCDFDAIWRAHVYANAGGQKVYAEAGVTYNISADAFTKTIPITTDVDFCGATFIIDDVGSAAFANRALNLFHIQSVLPTTLLTKGEITELAGEGYKITSATTDMAWLEPKLSGKSLIKVVNASHKDFIRHGNNQSSGKSRTEIFVLEADGSFAGDNVFAFDFDQITSINITPATDTPITVENGIFHNICCKTVPETSYQNSYTTYQRGFRITRSNVTVKNMTHRMIDEPAIGYYDKNASYTVDDHYQLYGSRHESYPYYGFLRIDDCYALKVLSSSLTGHTMYYQDKPATDSTGGKIPDPVRMGSYDFVIDFSYDITFDGVTQYSETGIGDEKYYGIMASNGCKNLYFNNCAINRFDAHMGVWNATIKNTEIGHTLNIIGGGEFYAENLTRTYGKAFISLRKDYGASYNGNITLKNCTHTAYTAYNTNQGGVPNTTVSSSAIMIQSGFSTDNSGYNASKPNGAYWLWDFGYTCYMPRNVVIDNYQTAAAKLYVFNNLPDDVFVKNYYGEGAPGPYSVQYPYVITESITFRNMKAVPITSSTGCTKLRAIKVIKE